MSNAQNLSKHGNSPAFSAYGSALQSVANATYTKIAFNTEEFDTNSNYDTTLYRFNPKVSGYYHVNAVCVFGASLTAGVRGIVSIYKNGSSFKLSSANLNSVSQTNIMNSALIYLNGSTDYIETFGYQDSGGALSSGSANSTVTFSASLVRAA